jgi:uncharacterized protein YdaU (DUF1376 family)
MSLAFTAMYWAEFEADTTDLTNTELGIYTRLLSYYYRKGPGITANPKRLQRVTIVSRNGIKSVTFIVAHYFTLKGGHLYHKRADKEIGKALDKSNKAAKSAHVRWDANAYANAMQTHTKRICERNAIKSKSKNKDKLHWSNDFDRWWSVYPKKVGKKPCKAIWKRTKPDADVLILDAQKRIAGDDQWRSGYVPNPQTYLNQERWNDEIQKRVDRSAQPESKSQSFKTYDPDAKIEVAPGVAHDYSEQS